MHFWFQTADESLKPSLCLGWSLGYKIRNNRWRCIRVEGYQTIRAISSHFWSLWWTILIQRPSVRHSTTASRILPSRPVIPASSLTWPSTRRTCYFAPLHCRMLLLHSWTIELLSVFFSVLITAIFGHRRLFSSCFELWMPYGWVAFISLPGVLWNRDIVNFRTSARNFSKPKIAGRCSEFIFFVVSVVHCFILSLVTFPFYHLSWEKFFSGAKTVIFLHTRDTCTCTCTCNIVCISAHF